MKKIKKLISVLVCMAMLCAVLPAMTVGAEEPSEEFDEIFKYYGMQSSTAPVHTFDKVYTGEMRIEFDLVVNSFSDGVIAFSNNSGIFGPEAIAIHTNGSFIARNGDGNGSATQESFYTPELGEIYHFSITTDTTKHVWSGEMTTPDGETVIVADNYGYRTNQDSIDRIIMLRNTSTAAYVDDVELSNLKIYGNGNAMCGDNLTWTLDDEGTLTISGTGDMWNWSDSTSNLAPWWNKYNSLIKAVNIENGVTKIGQYAFYACTALKSINIPDSVKSIDGYGLSYCFNLTSVTIPSSVTYIGWGAFASSAITDIYYSGTEEDWNNIYISDGNSYLSSITIHYQEGSDTGIIESGKCGDNLTWTLDSDGTLTISGTGAMTDWSWGNSPWDSSDKIKSVIIESGVTSIGKYAFHYCKSLTSVTIPNSVTTIGESAFSHCSGLISVTMGNSVTSIGEYAFEFCSGLKSVSIPDGVTEIGDWAFRDCTGLTGVIIPDSVTTIGDRAFWYCSGLKSVSIGSGVTAIGYSVFEDCSGLTSINVSDKNQNYTDINGVLFTKDVTVLVQYPAGKPQTEYNIPNGVTSIGDGAFENCSGLTSVTIPDSVTSIGEYAFGWCSGLISVTIPDSVTRIGNHAFYYCAGLTGINVSDENPNYTDVDGVLFTKDATELIQYPIGNSQTEYNIPNGVTSIGDDAFYYCKSLTSVKIPDSVTSIGEDAFGWCSSLISVTMGNSVTSIGKYAFYACNGLTGVIIPAAVTSIGYEAFYDCDSLADVYYSGSEKDWNAISIGDKNDCLTNATIHYNSTMPEPTTGIVASGECGDNLTWTLDSDGVLTISGTGAMTDWNDYSRSPWHSNYESIKTAVIESGVTSIGYCAFPECTGLTSVTIPDSVTSIGEYAFYECTGLTSVTIPIGVTEIGPYAFDYCVSLTSVSIGSGVTEIGSYAFRRCTGLTSITIPNSVTSIGYEAFYRCTGLTSVEIPNSVTSIGYNAFFKTAYYNDEANWSDDVLYIGKYLIDANINYSVKDYTIKYGTVCIADKAFEDCSSLTSITIPDSVTSIGKDAFENCTGLTNLYITDLAAWCNIDFYDFYSTPMYCADNMYINGELAESVIIPDGITEIKKYTFCGWSTITSVTIPDSVTSIGECAFYLCSGLTSVTIPDSVTSIGGNAFENCSSLTSVEIPDSVISIGGYAFSGCISLTSVTIPNSVTTMGWGAFYNCSSLTSVTIPDSVTLIRNYAFSNCSSLTDVYYSGSEEQWNAIDILGGNDCLTNATIHYNSTMPEPKITGVKLTTETDGESEIITVTVETDDVFSNNALLAVGFGDGGVVSVSAIENGEATLPADGVTTVKVFAWESLESMKPLCAAKTVTAQ